MPQVEGNFCAEAFAWVEDVVASGSPLFYLCSERWHGTCTGALNGVPHGFYCARHFHRKHFKIPLCHHHAALHVFFDQRDRHEQGDQLRVYAEKVVASYARSDVALFVLREPRLRGHVRQACEGPPPAVPGGATMTSIGLLAAAGTDVFPRSWLPAKPELLMDSAEKSPTVLLATAYLAWINDRRPVCQLDFPHLARAIDAVLTAIPEELRQLVKRHLFTERSVARSSQKQQPSLCSI